jgi:hypothetical protein
VNVTWCDKLASTPVVGLKLDWTFATGNSFLESLSPVLSKLSVSDAPAFGIDALDAMNMIVTTNEGFQYAAAPGAISVGFARRFQVKYAATGNPSLEILSLSQPYSTLLDSALKQLVDFALRLPSSQNRTFSRIGIVTTTRVEEAEFPPGVKSLLGYFGTPWKHELEFYDIQATVALGEDLHWKDRCIHRITKPEGAEVIPVLNFDWQRTYNSSRPLNKTILNNELAAAHKAALDYFERLAEGSVFDENVPGVEQP